VVREGVQSALQIPLPHFLPVPVMDAHSPPALFRKAKFNELLYYTMQSHPSQDFSFRKILPPFPPSAG
jgi:hypothetical protein